MKTRFWPLFILALFAWRTNAQIPLPTVAGAPAIVDIGPHHRVCQRVSIDERGQTNISSYTELATGLNYLNPITGTWSESKEQFVITSRGYAMATNGQHKVILAPDINSGGSVDTVRDKMHPSGGRGQPAFQAR